MASCEATAPPFHCWEPPVNWPTSWMPAKFWIAPQATSTIARDHREREQDADGAAHQVRPEVAQLTGAGAGEAPYERHGDGDTDGGRDEVLHREAAGLHDVAHGLLAVVRLPVGVGDEGRGGVERLVRVDRGEAERAGQAALEPLQQVEEEDARPRRRRGRRADRRASASRCSGLAPMRLVDPLLDAQMLRRRSRRRPCSRRADGTRGPARR